MGQFNGMHCNTHQPDDKNNSKIRLRRHRNVSFFQCFKLLGLIQTDVSFLIQLVKHYLFYFVIVIWSTIIITLYFTLHYTSIKAELKRYIKVVISLYQCSLHVFFSAYNPTPILYIDFRLSTLIVYCLCDFQLKICKNGTLSLLLFEYYFEHVINFV